MTTCKPIDKITVEFENGEIVDLGLLEAFTPCSETPQALVQECEAQYEGPKKKFRKEKRAGEATQ